jgi:hypothetical protein
VFRDPPHAFGAPTSPPHAELDLGDSLERDQEAPSRKQRGVRVEERLSLVLDLFRPRSRPLEWSRQYL